jgi:hypothetical protein
MEKKPTTLKQRTILTNMHRLRREGIERQMADGVSFSAAVKATLDLFDTVGWHEVISRLARARGMVRSVGRPQDAAVRELAGQIAADAGWLLKQLAQEHKPTLLLPAESLPCEAQGVITRSRVIGQLRAARRLVAKCRRDAARIEANGGAALTDEQLVKIVSQLTRLRTAAMALAAGELVSTTPVARVIINGRLVTARRKGSRMTA